MLDPLFQSDLTGEGFAQRRPRDCAARVDGGDTHPRTAVPECDLNGTGFFALGFKGRLPELLRGVALHDEEEEGMADYTGERGRRRRGGRAGNVAENGLGQEKG